MILLDTSGLLSALDESQRYHRECAAFLSQVSPPLLLSPFVLAERHGVSEVLTLDERHFRAMRIERRKRFKVLPFDQ